MKNQSKSKYSQHKKKKVPMGKLKLEEMTRVKGIKEGHSELYNFLGEDIVKYNVEAEEKENFIFLTKVSWFKKTVREKIKLQKLLEKRLKR